MRLAYLFRIVTHDYETWTVPYLHGTFTAALISPETSDPGKLSAQQLFPHLVARLTAVVEGLISPHLPLLGHFVSITPASHPPL